jgi:hypothetical protein
MILSSHRAEPQADAALSRSRAPDSPIMPILPVTLSGGAGRASVSSLLADLIEQHRAVLQEDARRALIRAFLKSVACNKYSGQRC